MNGKVLVVGSVNIDLVTRVKRFPRPGETLLGSDYETHHGGKGANQAVAAARLGAEVSFLGRVGRDDFGQRLRRGLSEEGIATGRLIDVEGASGAAFITLDATGQNTIIVAPGANSRLEPDDLPAEAFSQADVVVLQLEIPTATVMRGIDLGRQSGVKVIVNAAPAGAMTVDELAGCDLLVVNETEAATLLPGGSAVEPERLLEALGERFPAVVLTLGSKGLLWRSAGESGRAESGRARAHPVIVVDTTAAGDAFVGAAAAALAGGSGLEEAVRLGNAAGALAVTKAGAQPSLPRLEELQRLLASDPHA
ncbi:MAG: ribokinase [Trueperaceae bacterium]